jgi:predicted PurR-regulated permease PerM
MLNFNYPRTMTKDQNFSPDNKSTPSFSHKVWIVTGILTLSVIVVFVLKAAFSVLLIVLASILIAVFFHGLGDMIERITKLKHRYSVLIGVFITLSFVSGLFWFMGSTIQAQIAELSSDFPEMIDKARASLSHSFVGNKILENVSGFDDSKIMSTAQGFFNTSFGVIGDIYIIIFLGIFFTVDPSIYKNGIIKLTPVSGKEDARIVMERIGVVLKGWLKGMMLAMFLISILTLIALTIFKIPLALTLAILAGLLNFIPNFGPLMAMIPAVLIGFTISVNMAIIIAVTYLVIQTIESNVVTPMIQKKMINLPPALTIMSQVLMGTVSGFLGILLATPLLAIIIVLVDELYIKKQNNIEVSNDTVSM